MDQPTTTNEARESYEAPALVCFGTLAELTQSGSGTQPEGGTPLRSKFV